MGYLHIENLYRPEAQKILEFRRVYVLEKIHGTSANILWKERSLKLHPGGESLEKFQGVFDGKRAPIQDELAQVFSELFLDGEVRVFGEAYGGKCQGMSKTYGPQLMFVAFDVQVGDAWLAVPQAQDICHKLGIPFVWNELVSSDLTSLDAARDRDSEQSRRNGITEPRPQEGVVIRPPYEVTLNNGARLIAKHKRPEFSERKTIPGVDPSKREMLERSDAIADEWVTEMRLTHILDKIGNPTSHRDIPAVIAAMVEDVCREASGEIVDSKDARRAIGAKAVQLYKARIERVVATEDGEVR